MLHFLQFLNIMIQLPLGHLRPLGWQRRAESSILEDSLQIDSERFYIICMFKVIVQSLYVALFHHSIFSGQIVIYRNIMGHLNITVIKRRQRLIDTLMIISFKTFLERYRQDDLYMNTIIHDEMKHETPLPSLINCGTFRDRLLEPILWD